MKTTAFLEVEIRDLPSVRVVHRSCLFRSNARDYDKTIRRVFKELRERVCEYGLDPDALLHIGVPEVVDGEPVSYDCCVEFPIPVEAADGIKVLPGGHYAVLSVEKTPARIGPAIRQFRGDYLPDHGLVPDEDRPTYEIYFKDLLEFCIPIR